MCEQFKKLFFCITFIICVTNCAKLPENIKKCSRNDPNLSECLRVNVNDALIKMKDGIPSLGIAPLEPLFVNGFEIGADDGPVNLKQTFTNMTLAGISDNIITKYEADLEHYRIYSEAISPLLILTGNYEMNGRILVLPVQGNGNCNITMVNVKTTHVLQGEPFEKKGKKYWRLTDYKITLGPERVYMYFGNLFNGDRLLGETTNNFMNEQWKEIFGELKPGYEETFGIIFKDIANRIFTRVPFNDVFVD